MNAFVALPIAAALPVAAPAMAGESPDGHAATLARAEQIVETLRNKHVADGWALFEPAAEEMLGFFRRRLEGKPERDNEFRMDVVEFFGAHGQSLDWVLFGDPSVMICRLAAAKSEERGEADVELLDLVDQYVAAQAEHERLRKIAEGLETAFLDEGKPKAVRVRAGDADLGIRAFIGRLGKDHNPFNIDVLRAPEWPAPDSKVELGTGRVRIIAERLVKPSAEARARADQIIAAFDQWRKNRKEKKPRRLLTAERKRDECDDRVQALEERIAEMTAATSAGMIAKARCIVDEEYWPDCDDALSIFSTSIVRDLLAADVKRSGGTAAVNLPAPVASTDPMFGLIEAHRKAHAAWEASLDELERLEKIHGYGADGLSAVTEEPCRSAHDAFIALADGAATTLPGLRAKAKYLQDLTEIEAWMFVDYDDVAAHLVSGLVASMENILTMA
ncbi:hypothetical protein V1281_001893 [Nitrobacteraceae bacterium AZCC 2161]